LAPGPPHDRKEEFEEVALPHFDALFNLALNLTRNRKDAEDLVQEAFLRAYRFFDTYRAGTQIRAWLFRILRNTFINRYRAARARPDEVDFGRIESSYEQTIDQVFARDHGQPTPEDIVMEGILDSEVQQALAALPEEYRSVVLLALVEELSYKEIAAALSIPLGTVMSRLHRGRKALQAALLEFARRKGILRPGAGVPTDGEGAAT
jgi:RNA polymerase sigma-70 factor (ECF subfamily)